MGVLRAKVGGTWIDVVNGVDSNRADVAHWNSAWGLVAWAQITADVTGIQTSDVTIVSIPSYTMTAGRRYMIKGETFVYKANPDSTATVVARLVLDATTIQQRNFSVTAPGTQSVHLEMEYDAIGGAHGYYLKVATTAGFVNVSAGGSYPTWLSIEDMGPITQAAVNPPAGQPTIATAGNALGIVKMGSFVAPYAPHPVALNTATALTTPLTFTMATGRRYRLFLQIRAIEPTTLNNTSVSFYLRIDGTLVRGYTYGADPYVFMDGQFQGATYTWLFDGDGASHAYEVIAQGGACNIYTDSGMFYLEDVGPNSAPALPIPATDPPWTPLVLTNGFGVANSYPSQYRKVGDVVELRGDVLTPAVGSTFAYIAQLPAGFRPPKKVQFPTLFYTGVFVPVVCAVEPGGLIQLSCTTSNINAGWDGNIDVVRFSVTP